MVDYASYIPSRKGPANFPARNCSSSIFGMCGFDICILIVQTAEYWHSYLRGGNLKHSKSWELKGIRVLAIYPPTIERNRYRRQYDHSERCGLFS